MRKRTSGLLATAAAAALVFGLAGSASAFDIVDWSWDKDVVETVTIGIVIQNVLVPTGVVEIEKLQMHFGDITANAVVGGIYNNPPIEGDGGLEPFQVLANIDGSLVYTPSNGGSANTITAGQGLSSNNLNVEVQNITGNVDEAEADADGANVDINFDIVVQVDPGDIEFGDAIDVAALPEVVNAATAVANNQQIVSSSALMLHDAQIAAGDINPIGGNCDNECGAPDPIAFLIAAWLLTEIDDELEGLNAHTDIAALTILGAATGFVNPASITANATVSDILNATVDNAATAVGNNASYEITTDVAENATMIADLTQLLIGDVTANAAVGGVTVNNYDLAGLDRPLVSNIATAVGNNLNVKVGVGESE